MLVQRARAGEEAGSEVEGGKRPGQAVGGGDQAAAAGAAAVPGPYTHMSCTSGT